MGKKKMVRTEQTTIEEYYNFPIEDILSDARLVLEAGDECDCKIIAIPIFYHSGPLKKQQAEMRLKEKYSCIAGGRKPGGNIEQKTRVTHLKVHRGGLYKPSERPTYKADDLLSGEFKAWQRARRAKPDHHDNA